MNADVFAKLPKFIAVIPSGMLDETGVAAAFVLLGGGTLLHLYLPQLEMAAEERVKARALTSEAALRKICFYRACAGFLTLAGALGLVFVMVDLTR